MTKKKASHEVKVTAQTEVAEEVIELTPEAPEDAPKETTAEALAAEAEHDVELKKTRRPITVKFTDHHVMERAREAAELSFRRAEVDAELARVKSSFKGRLDDLDQGIAECLKEVRDGTEQRIVDLEDHYDYTDGVVRTYHNSELIEDRALTAEERQIGIKFVEKKVLQEIDAGEAAQPDLLDEALATDAVAAN